LTILVKIAVPPQGLGRQLELMHAWLDETFGRAGWSSAPAGIAGTADAAFAFCFENAAFAYAFVLRFCCGYRAETIADGSAARHDWPELRGVGRRFAAPPDRH
jgi:hypothetical protein